MSSQRRTRRQRVLWIEQMEGRALLSTLSINPYGHPGSSHQVYLATTGGTTTGGGATTGTGASSGTGATTCGMGATTGTGSGSSASFPGTEGHSYFHYHGGHTDYSLEQKGGGYKFNHNYSLDIQRDRHSARDGSFTAADAVQTFQDRFLAHAGQAIPNGAGASNGDPASLQASGYSVQNEHFHTHGGFSEYDLTIRAGGYQFIEHYTLNINRDHSSPRDGSVTAADAITDFFGQFQTRASQAVPGGGTGTGSSTSTGTATTTAISASTMGMTSGSGSMSYR